MKSLRLTSKGQLKYDRDWVKEGRQQEIVSGIELDLVSLTLSPDSVIAKYEDITPEEEKWEFTPPSSPGTEGQQQNQSSTTIQQQSLDNLSDTDSSSSDVSPEQFRQLLDYEDQKKQEVQKTIANLEQHVLEQMRDREMKADEGLRQLRAKYANDSIERVNKLYRDITVYLDSVMNEAKRISATQSMSSPNIERKLKEVEDRKKQLEKEQAVEAEEKRRMERIDKINGHFNSIQPSTQKMLDIIGRTLTANKNLQAIPLFKDIQDLKTRLSESFSKLDSLSKVKDPNDQDVMTAGEEALKAVDVIKDGNEILRKFNQEIQRLEKEAKEAEQREREREREQQASIGQAPSPSTPLPTTTPSSSCISSALTEYASKHKLINEVEERLRPFTESTDAKIKLYRVKLQNFIRTQINAICPNSNDHLKQKYQKLALLFEGGNIEFQDTTFNTKGHPLAAEFCMVYAAKTFLSVGCKQIQSVPLSSFCFAAIVSLLWSRFPQVFGNIFLALIIDKCPYLVAYYPAKDPETSDVDYLVSCGYTFGPDQQTLETEEFFLNRMRSFARFYGAISVSKAPLSDNHPHGIKFSWVFLSRTLTSDPRPGITAAMLHAFLSVTVHRLHQVYKGQFVKMLLFLDKEYIPKIEAIANQEKRQAVSQLKTFLQEILKKITKQGGKGIKPEGVLSDYFWQKSYLHS